VVGGSVLIILRLGVFAGRSGAPPRRPPRRPGSAAWRSPAASRSPGVEPWTRQALACEILTQLRPSLNDYWYREGRREIPSSLEDIVAGRAPDREALLFWRALRRTLAGPPTRRKA
jgi:hypothetical protein